MLDSERSKHVRFQLEVKFCQNASTLQLRPLQNNHRSVAIPQVVFSTLNIALGQEFAKRKTRIDRAHPQQGNAGLPPLLFDSPVEGPISGGNVYPLLASRNDFSNQRKTKQEKRDQKGQFSRPTLSICVSNELFSDLE
ncbi:MAG: hypothetical protein CMO61_14330 [Verrucomicrobiales bacterium]|nr:hypothetical protein [Verrucomicrobiales bacterium]